MRFLLISLILLAGCKREAYPARVSGVRLVSTAPNLTECVCAIGADGLLVGRTTACDHPPQLVKKIAVTGDYARPWLEPLLRQNPTHVLADTLPDGETATRLIELGVHVEWVRCNQLDEIPRALRQLGALTHHEKEAARVAHSIESAISAARTEASHITTRPRVLLLFAPDTPITAGRNAFIATLLELAGGCNVGAASETDFYHVSLEWIVMQDPDLIICLFDTGKAAPASLFAKQIGWTKLRALREGRIYGVADLGSVSRPGPRVLEGLTQLRELLQRDGNRDNR